MSLYHETAQILSDTSRGGSLKSRVFGKKGLKSPPGQVYALAVESCRYSEILKEVIEGSGLLSERKVRSPVPHILTQFLMTWSHVLRSYSLHTWDRVVPSSPLLQRAPKPERARQTNTPS